MATLLSEAYNAERRKLAGATASLELRPGSIEGFSAAIKLQREGKRRSPMPPAPASRRLAGLAVRAAIRCISILSMRPATWCRRRRRAVGCNRRRSFPNLAFPRHARTNVLAGRRPSGVARARQTPAHHAFTHLALRDGEPYLAWGTPGGDQQDQWITQLFLRHVHAGLNLQEAIDAPAWHSEHFPCSFWPRAARPGVLVVEGRVPRENRRRARAARHIVEVGADWSEGRLTAAAREGAAAAPPPIRAACRVTPQDGEERESFASRHRREEGFDLGAQPDGCVLDFFGCGQHGFAELRVCVTPLATSPSAATTALAAGGGVGDVERYFARCQSPAPRPSRRLRMCSC